MKDEGGREGGGRRGEGGRKATTQPQETLAEPVAHSGRGKEGKGEAESGKGEGGQPSPLTLSRRERGLFRSLAPWPLRSQPAQPVGLGEDKNPSPFRLPPSAFHFPLRAGHAGQPRVGLDGHAQRPGRGLEDRLGDVVAVAAVVHDDVQIAQGVGGEGLPEVGHQLGCRTRRSWRVGNSAWKTKYARPPRSMAAVHSVSSIGSVKWP